MTMKKILLALATVATIAAASASPASALTILKPTGCCGGWNPQPHWGGGISVGIGLGGGVGVVDPGFGYGGGCYHAYRQVLIPNVGLVMKKTLVCS
jgi:hypothetical protein